MSQQLISHSPDLKKLQDEGFELEVRSGYLIVRHIPYVNPSRQIKFGVLVSQLNLSNNVQTARPNTHVIFFIGEHPCDKEGRTITAIQHSSQRQDLGNGIVIEHSFSNKPKTGYADFYEKITRYAEIITAPAKSLDGSVTEKTFTVLPEEDAEGVFQYLDTNSSRANVNRLNAKFAGQKIGIIGLGGTGAYVLDLVAKTPVQEIHLFDGDEFLQHNAFRSPGAASSAELNQKMKKVAYYKGVYEKMHRGIVVHDYFINMGNLGELDPLHYVFICVDRNSVRGAIMRHLIEQKISFIDVGLGVLLVEDCLIGTIRLTAGTSAKNDHLGSRVPCGDVDDDNAYSSNIQIADLNALNAAMAVIKWKKLSGFYQDLEREHHSTYSLNVAQLINEDLATSIC